MPSYIDPKTGKRVNTRYTKPPVPKTPKPKNPPPDAASYKDPQTGEWKTLRRKRTPEEQLGGVAGTATAEENWYWRRFRAKQKQETEPEE